jgi:hypothetical protein
MRKQVKANHQWPIANRQLPIANSLAKNLLPCAPSSVTTELFLYNRISWYKKFEEHINQVLLLRLNPNFAIHLCPFEKTLTTRLLLEEIFSLQLADKMN